MNEGDAGKDFTVQEVVERSGQSLRSFYQYFGGKHELLLALFEESVRWTAEQPAPADGRGARRPGAPAPLRGRVLPDVPIGDQRQVAAPVGPSAGDQVVERARPRPSRTQGGGQVAAGPDAGHGRLRPAAADRLPDRGRGRPSRRWSPCSGRSSTTPAEAGAVRPGLRHGPIAGIVLEAIMFNAFSMTIGGVSVRQRGDPAEELWDLVLHGVGREPAYDRPPWPVQRRPTVSPGGRPCRPSSRTAPPR